MPPVPTPGYKFSVPMVGLYGSISFEQTVQVNTRNPKASNLQCLTSIALIPPCITALKFKGAIPINPE